jgi:hypothetical protein
MTGSTPAGGACAEMPPALVAAYAGGGLAAATAWSVEAHLPGCPACRAALAASTDAGRLSRNRGEVLARLGLPRPGPLGRVLRRCGVPEHVIVLLAATPSLRRSWLAGVLLVLTVATASTQLATRHLPAVATLALTSPAGWSPLVPFLVIAPLLPLAAVAAAFSPGIDPAYGLAKAAPISKAWLLCVRCVAVVVTTLVPTALAALAMPGPAWLAAVVLLPAVAVSATALALATVTRPLWATIAAAVGWAASVIAVGVVAGEPAEVFGVVGQLTAAAVVLAAAALVAVRRNKIDYLWTG